MLQSIQEPAGLEARPEATKRPAPLAIEGIETPRVIADLGSSDGAGPTLLVIAGLHGNEPAGILAAQRVAARIRSAGIPLAGRFVALAGNLAGLAASKRYIDRDLNRAWQPDRIQALRQGETPETWEAEDGEQLELLDAIDAVIEASGDDLCVVDLHSTSAQSGPFVLFADTLANRSFALHFPLTLVLGLEEQIEGALLNYLQLRPGIITMGVEGGQHQDPASADNMESVLWLALSTAGLLPDEDLVDLPAHMERLRAAAGELPRLIEVRYRHAIAESDGFIMEPGFVNFGEVSRGTLLARDRKGPILARENGRVLMPLYQGLGEDGFFFTRPVRPIWLLVSEHLRRQHIGRLLPLLPGVRRHPDKAGTLLVDTRVARIYPLQIFHLFGFRRQRWSQDLLEVSRRV
jgi:succinylglutamate desuccinylase